MNRCPIEFLRLCPACCKELDGNPVPDTDDTMEPCEKCGHVLSTDYCRVFVK